MIFLRYQKKIENSFATSLFEHQTKFVRNHEKMVETLETLYKKYEVFVSHYMDMQGSIVSGDIEFFSDEQKQEFFNASVGMLYSDISDFSQYYRNNRLYLWEHANDRIGNLINFSYAFVIAVRSDTSVATARIRRDVLQEQIKLLEDLYKSEAETKQ